MKEKRSTVLLLLIIVSWRDSTKIFTHPSTAGGYSFAKIMQ